MVPIRGILGLYRGYMGDNGKIETTIMGDMGGCQNYGTHQGNIGVISGLYGG